MEANPPLIWLRAFEAAGRHLSFKDAASELNVSPSTISHQIRDLESMLGRPLFARGKNSLALTEEGERFLIPLVSGFDLIRRASVESPNTGCFRIGTFPFLGSEVLLPKAQELKGILDTEEISFHTQTDQAKLLSIKDKERLDVIIKYGPDPAGRRTAFPGYLSIPLFPIKLIPILRAGVPLPGSTKELLRQPLVKLAGPFGAWESWAYHFNVELPVRDISLQTDNYHAAVLAVERGEGICLGVFPFLEPWVQMGRVQAAHQFASEIPEYAYMVYAQHNEHNPRMKLLASWLQRILG